MYEYGAEFYSFLNSFAVRSAQRIAPLVAAALPVSSVADFGCGQGAWLSVWKSLGAEIVGVDGPYVDRSRLLIPKDTFHAADLAAPIQLGRRFDLVQSLETAEHLPTSAAQQFIRLLAFHADAVLFSAAVPGQGGEHHINERPLSFWRALFAAEGYRPVDLIRPGVRGDPDVQRWYQCNTILYVNAQATEHLSCDAKRLLMADDEPLATYWTRAERARQALTRTLPKSTVNLLSRVNTAWIARLQAKSGQP